MRFKKERKPKNKKLQNTKKYIVLPSCTISCFARAVVQTGTVLVSLLLVGCYKPVSLGGLVIMHQVLCAWNLCSTVWGESAGLFWVLFVLCVCSMPDWTESGDWMGDNLDGEGA
jgi:hypothetical protein